MKPIFSSLLRFAEDRHVCDSAFRHAVIGMLTQRKRGERMIDALARVSEYARLETDRTKSLAGTP